jgi:hypothetical protein
VKYFCIQCCSFLTGNVIIDAEITVLYGMDVSFRDIYFTKCEKLYLFHTNVTEFFHLQENSTKLKHLKMWLCEIKNGSFPNADLTAVIRILSSQAEH